MNLVVPNLSGRSVLVTGAADGIGRAVARGVGVAGGAVLCVDVNDEGAAETVEMIRAAGGSSDRFRADVGDAAQARAAVDAAERAFGGLHGAVTCAGVLERTVPGDFDEEAWDRVIRVNLKGTFLICRSAVDAMRKVGEGSLVTISSIGAERPSYPGNESYHASKGGVLALTYAMAVRYGGFNIRANCLAPGYVDTAMTRIGERPPEALRRLRSRVPLRRPGVPEDFAGPAVFLLSDVSRYVTGSLLYVDGGAHSMGNPIPEEELD